MKIRTRKAQASTRFDAVKVKTVMVSDPSRLVTLDDPSAPPTLAQDAFCVLQPPEGLTPSEVDSWRQSVAALARAVKVLPQPKSAAVPIALQRIEDGTVVGTVREEAMALAEKTKNQAVVEMVKSVLDEVGVL